MIRPAALSANTYRETIIPTRMLTILGDDDDIGNDDDCDDDDDIGDYNDCGDFDDNGGCSTRGPGRLGDGGGDWLQGALHPGAGKKTSPQAKRHKPSLLFTSLTILTFITR